MPYTDLIREWHAAVQAVDEKDWVSALGLLENISEPTSKIFFTAASVHLVLGQLEQAIKALDRTIAKDERLAVAFFQRGAVHMLAGRLEEALSDCSLALKHFRGNSVIDYRQLGLRYQLHSWQVLYNAAAVHTRLGQWDKALDSLEKAAGLTGEGRGVSVEQAVVRVKCRMLLEPLMVPKGEVFRPRKQDVEQLIQRDFLGKPKVISSIIPDDDFAGFEPLRPQRPGFYEPKVDGLECRDSGSQALMPIVGDTELRALWERAEGGRTTVWCQYEDPLAGRPILYQVVALYDYESQGPEDLEFSKGDTIDILSEVNDEWLEGHTAGNIGIFPRCFIYQDTDVPSSIPKSMPT
ncbi:UNVERIFIED_CONTAM: hypothetical protein FKN15_001899 [Acipenser sinensis]